MSDAIEGTLAPQHQTKSLNTIPAWLKKTVWQDEKDFTLDVPVSLQNDQVYGKRKKFDVPDENLFASSNKILRKVMASSAISWFGATKPFFVNENDIK